MNPAPQWAKLARFNDCLSRATFERLLRTVYCPTGELHPDIRLTDSQVEILAPDPMVTVRFARSDPPRPAPPPLRGLRIAIDPGHLGGAWAELEERSFVIAGGQPVREGDLTLQVALRLRDQLAQAGAEVSLTRADTTPVTTRRPADFPAAEPWRFYRDAEIAARADLINKRIRPDLTLCLHFNAVPWGEPRALTTDNRLLFFVHGNYLPAEMANAGQRARLLEKMFTRVAETELPLAGLIAAAFQERTGLPPVEYPAGDVARRVGPHPCVYARNLAASRLYNGPVVYLEPYYMNSRAVYERVQAGDYVGLRMVAGQRQPSLVREYAAAVADGLGRYCRA